METTDTRKAKQGAKSGRQDSHDLLSSNAARPHEEARLERTPFHIRMFTNFRRLSSRFDRPVLEHVKSAISEEAAFGHDFLWLPVFMAVGAAYWFAVDRDPHPIAVFAILVLSWAAWLKLSEKPVLRFCIFLLAAGLTGMALAQIQVWRTPTVILDSDITTNITGQVEMREVDHLGRWRYTILVSETNEPEIRRPPQLVRILARARHDPIAIGSTINGLARMGPASGPALEGGYDFAFHFYFEGLGAYGFFFGKPEAVILPVTDGNQNLWAGMAREISWLRDTISQRIRSVLPGDTGGFASALAVADRRGISPETVEALRASGLAHVLAISGLHMALIAGGVFLFIRTMFGLSQWMVERWPVKKIAALAALLAASFYLLISGAAVSTQRAWLMFVIFLLAVLFDKPALTLRNVALAAIAIIVLKPSAVTGPGFQMSFAATVALVSVYAWWSRASRHRGEPILTVPKPVQWTLALFVGIAITSLVAGLATGMFAAAHFYRVAPYGLLANLAAMPIVTFVIMPSGLVSLLAMPFNLEYYPLHIMGVGLDAVITIAKWVESLGGDATTGRLHAAAFSIAVGGFLVSMLLRSWLRYCGFALLIVGLLVNIAASTHSYPELLISENGRLVAVFKDGEVHVNRSRPDEFILRQWTDALGAGYVVGPNNAPSGETNPDESRTAFLIKHVSAAGNSGPPGFHCVARTFCIYGMFVGQVVVVVEDLSFLGAACDVGSIVVTTANIRLDRCYSGAQLITGRTLRRSGSMEIIAKDGSLHTVGAVADKVRPWTRHRYYDWRTRSFQFE